MRYYFKKFMGGVVFFLGIAATALLAATIPAVFSDDEILSASKLNLMVTAITELQGQVGIRAPQKLTHSTLYQASTDGFVVINGDTFGGSSILAYGPTNPPAYSVLMDTGRNLPLPRGYFWRIIIIPIPGPVTVYPGVLWFPMGN